jgi:predicted transport protein
MDVRGVPMVGHESYLIYTDGRVYSTISGKYLKVFRAKRGFRQVCVDGKNVTVHIEMARAFATRDSKGLRKTVSNVRFKNGVKGDLRLENIAWDEH